MVQLEEVKDAELNAEQPGPVSDEFEDDADFTDTGTFHLSIPSIFSAPAPFAHVPNLPSCSKFSKMASLTRARPCGNYLKVVIVAV